MLGDKAGRTTTFKQLLTRQVGQQDFDSSALCYIYQDYPRRSKKENHSACRSLINKGTDSITVSCILIYYSKQDLRVTNIIQRQLHEIILLRKKCALLGIIDDKPDSALGESLVYCDDGVSHCDAFFVSNGRSDSNNS